MNKLSEKNIVLLSFSTLIIVLMFILFYFATRNSLYIYLFSTLYFLFLSYFFCIYISNINSRAKLIIKTLPLLIISLSIGSFSLYAFIVTRGGGSIVSFGILLFLVSILSIGQLIKLLRTGFEITSDKIYFKGSIKKSVEIKKIYGIMKGDAYIILFFSKKESEEYENEVVSKFNNKKNNRLINNITLLEEINQNYNSIIIDVEKFLSELKGFVYDKEKDLWINQKYESK